MSGRWVAVLLLLAQVASAGLARQAAGAPPANTGAAMTPPSRTIHHDHSILDHALLEWRQTPRMRVEDAYKWLYQACLGGEHAVSDEAGPREWLTSEWAGLDTLDAAGVAEPLAESLRADGSILRINLRPYKASGGEPETLLSAFVHSARAFKGEKAEFLDAWSELGRRLARGPVGACTRADWETLDRAVKPLGYPAIHHSREYETAYRPAYRVVLAAVWRAAAAR